MPRAMQTATLKLGSVDHYVAEVLKYEDERTLRQEYSRLRAIAMKRLDRFEGTEWEDTDTYRENRNKYPKLTEIKSKAKLSKHLQELARYVDASTSTISGLRQQRARTIASLHDQGYDFVNTKNFRDFTDFMEEQRSQGVWKKGGSPTPEALETYFNAKQKGIPTEALEEDFEFWQKNRKKLKNIELPKGKRHTASNYRKALEGKLK